MKALCRRRCRGGLVCDFLDLCATGAHHLDELPGERCPAFLEPPPQGGLQVAGGEHGVFGEFAHRHQQFFDALLGCGSRGNQLQMQRDCGLDGHLLDFFFTRSAFGHGKSSSILPSGNRLVRFCILLHLFHFVKRGNSV